MSLRGTTVWLLGAAGGELGAGEHHDILVSRLAATEPQALSCWCLLFCVLPACTRDPNRACLVRCGQ
jgi:hypothetical protein